MKVPPEMAAELAQMQAFTDAMLAQQGGQPEQLTEPEWRVVFPYPVLHELGWVEDDVLSDAIAATVAGGSAESEEEGGEAVFYCVGLDLPDLRALVAEVIGSRYTVTVEPAPDHAEAAQQMRVSQERVA